MHGVRMRIFDIENVGAMKFKAPWRVALLCAALLLTICGNAGFLQAQSTPVAAGYRDFYFGKSVNGLLTGEKPQSKLWWNDGLWWGSLWDLAIKKYTVHRFNVATQSWTSTGTAIDTRVDSKGDALWDGQYLYFVSQHFTNSPGPATGSDGGRLYRYSYNAAAKSYSLDAGFPVMVNNSLSETLVLAKDSTGKLWVTWTEGGKVKVNRSLGDDLTWGTPFDLPVQGTDTKIDDISSILAFGGNKIGILWSNQNDKKSYFAVHLDGSADEVWEPKEQALADAALGAVSYDHINLKPSCDNDGNVYAATKTNLTQSGLPLVYLLKRTAAGVWTRYLVSTVDEHYIRPIVLIDGANHKIYVFATSEATGHRSIYMKSSDLSNIAFAPGLGTPFIQSVTDTVIMNPTSTKQCLNGATGLLVLAADQHTRTYLHNYLDLSGGTNQFALTANTTPQGGGSVALDPPGGTYNAGTMVTLTATPNSGYQFSGWSGDLSGSTNPATIAMNGNKNVTATFTVIPSSGSIVHEESQTGGSSGSVTVMTSASLTGANGNLYLAAISTRPRKLVQSVTGLGLNWTLVKSICSGNNSTTGMEVWMAQGTPSGNGAVAATFGSAPSTAVITVSRYSGTSTANPIGNVIAGNTKGLNGACTGGVDGNAYSFNLTTTANEAVVYGAVALKARSHNPGAGYTERVEFQHPHAVNPIGIAVEDKSVTSPASVTLNGSFNGPVDWAVVALEIKPATTSPGNSIVYEESQTGGASGSVTVTTAASLTGVSGHLYLAAISTRPRKLVQSVTGLGLNWTLVKSTCSGNNSTTGMEVWMAQGIPQGGSNGAVAATFASAPSTAVIAVSRYSGVAAANPIGNVIGGNTNGLNGTCSGGVDGNAYSFNLATTVNDAVVYGAVALKARTHTPGAGYTERVEFQHPHAVNPIGVAVEDKSVASAATVAMDGSFNGPVDWALVALEIKPQGTMGKRSEVTASENIALPSDFQLEPNYPNPFNLSTLIRFGLPQESHIAIKIYSIEGREVETLVDGAYPAGTHTVVFHVGNLPSGIYFYMMQAGEIRKVRQLLLLK